uniref:histidine kinase n=1 Tax=Nicotiana tabacum TaxID=4097 RepID=A0A1S4BST1_TOBAC|nr:PREDICTED: histidine kinase CKI1-like [Nicotiana tabacum]
MVLDQCKIPWKLHKDITLIQKIVRQHNIKVMHCYREGNGVADLLSKHANSVTRSVIYTNENDLPPEIRDVVRVDRIQVPAFRLKAKKHSGWLRYPWGLNSVRWVGIGTGGSTMVIWSKPEGNFWKLNTDGSYIANQGKVKVGDIDRNKNGHMVMAFASPVQFLTNNYSEVQAALQEIQWCCARNCFNFTLEIDSLLVVNMVLDQCKIPWKLHKDITLIQKIVRQHNIKVMHYYREGNGVADILSKHANSVTRSVIYTNENDLPPEIRGVVRVNRIQVPAFRLKAKKHSGWFLQLSEEKYLLFLCLMSQLIERNIELKLVYISGNTQDILQSHFHKNIKFGFMLIILMMVSMAISIFTFVVLTIRAARREMYLCAALIKQMEATQQAERKSMNKSTAFVLANHDIRASLAGISGLIEMCRANASPKSELQKNLNHMETCTNNLLAILNSILDQSKIEEGKKQLEQKEFNMEDLLEYVVNLFYPKGAMNNVDVILDPCDGSIKRFSRVKGDKTELERILTNLLSNAVKFTSEGHITLRVWARKPGFDQSSISSAPNTSNSGIGCMLCLLLHNNNEVSAEFQVHKKVENDPNCVEFIFEVEDTGKGIPKEKHKSVFENYVQVNETTSNHEQPGTGLGLSITQSLVHLMGGEISIVDKNIGAKGTCFRFNIFLISCDQPQQHQAFSVNNAREDLESHFGGYISSDHSYHYSVASSNSITSHQKPESSSTVILFIREEERSRVLRRFVTRIIGLEVHVARQHEQFSHKLKKVKKEIINFSSYNSASSSSGKSKEIPLGALEGTYDDHIPSFHRRERGLNSKSALIRFIVIIIDTSAGPIREITRAMAEFRKDFPKNVSLRVVWLDKPGLDDDKLPSTDIILTKPLHGSCLYHVLGFVPEFGDKILPTVTQETKDETTSRMRIQQPPMRSRSPPLEAKREDVSVDVNGSSNNNLPLTGKRILVVEDNAILLMVCKRMVSQLGATIYTCKNGEQALAHIRTGLSDQRDIGPSTPSPPFDYILMDCEMPLMDGFEATRCIREEEARYGIRIPIIALTAHSAEEEIIAKIFQVGMDYYLPDKRIDRDELLKAIDYIEHRNV